MRTVRTRRHLWRAVRGSGDSSAPLGSPLAFGSADDSMIAAMRLTLASAALLIVYIDLLEPDRYVTTTYAALALYIVYSAVILVMTLRVRPLALLGVTHWIDVGWYVVFIGLSSGTNSIFFFFFFFAILVASFRWGFTTGLRVAATSAALFTVVGFTMAPVEPDFELKLFFLRPVSLAVLGYMMAYWGGSENRLKRRLAFLKDINALSNPRFGVDRMLSSLMERLRTFYNADVCLLLTVDRGTGKYHLRRASRLSPQAGERTEPITEDITRLLLTLPATYALISMGASRLLHRWCAAARISAYDVVSAARRADTPKIDEVFKAELLARSCITVPVLHRGETMGRLYLIASRRRAFEATDVAFLLQVLEHTIPFIDNIRLVDQLASDAAETERQRIARDLHDSVIQSYIGLQIGLAGIRQKLTAGGVDIREDLERVSSLTNIGIAQLRRYMGELKDGGEHTGGLIPAVQRFAVKFTEATGIAVHVEAGSPLQVSDRLAAEVFQMVAEGLSNVRRHTSSAWATIRLADQCDHLVLHIENDASEAPTPVSFTPRSLTARAVALGGSARVEWHEPGRTIVAVDIPL